ncbi:MAG: bifunctional demethylmenaquinone methyltransferase/2-methoxy-6-polyprenyl-1,4-benzoquinol methylase UbiE [Bdellovibrionota bacterium]
MKSTEKVPLTDKAADIRKMFNAIAPRYDFLNHFLSLGADRLWRRFAVSKVKYADANRETALILDVATGTGDLAFEIASQTPETVKIIGIDFSEDMIELAVKKLKKTRHSGRIKFEAGECEAIQYPEDTFDTVTIAFGIRNLVDRARGLSEIKRVLKPGGKVLILELSNPKPAIFKSLYYFYFRRILPRVGSMFSAGSAYRYLPASVIEFPSAQDFSRLMSSVGFKSVTYHELSFGIATLFIGHK